VPPSGCEAEGAPLAEGDTPPLPLPSGEALREGSAQGDAKGEHQQRASMPLAR
jgi:hypothetical protein